MKLKMPTFIGLRIVVLCILVALVCILARNAGEGQTGDQRVTIRFAHWQLEDGPREAFDRIAARYMQIHPNVRVVQLPIPERIYTNWLITQLVGETAPDLIQISVTANDERTARFFTPLSNLASTPNPYNQGTDLEKVPLRETLFDGMEGGYNSNLFHHYGVPISGFTIRMFYNVELLGKITGSTHIPETYEELVAVCQKVKEYSRHQGLPIVPIAGSRYNGPMLLSRLFASQTQTLVQKLNPVGIVGGDAVRRAGDYLDGRWSLDSPEVRSGFDLLREVSQFMQPGFLQLQRDDATLLFVQQRAVMICTGSWDATSIRRQADFPIGVGIIPFPSKTHPVYGRYTLGSLSEAGTNGGIVFGLTRHCQNPEIARDFLLFLSSRPVNQLWTDASHWIPAVIGTNVDDKVAPFLPVTQGELSGISPTIDSQGDGMAFPEVRRTYMNSLYQLMDPSESTASFINLIREGYSKGIISDLRRQSRMSLDLIQGSDTQGTALAWQARRGNAGSQRRYENFLQSSSLNERKYFQIQLILRSNQSSPR
ncbi:MAG TPA: extracellular solute-binding protein [Chthoniobacteraceae bacterium]|nr:extracellular solute-binding protein [Chthoniobacteraceae bacterium]